MLVAYAEILNQVQDDSLFEKQQSILKNRKLANRADHARIHIRLQRFWSAFAAIAAVLDAAKWQLWPCHRGLVHPQHADL
jgi:hypothetical protein